MNVTRETANAANFICCLLAPQVVTLLAQLAMQLAIWNIFLEY